MTRLQIGTAIAAIIQALGLATATAQTTSTAVASGPDDPQAVAFFQQAKRLEPSQDTAPLRRHLTEYIEMWGERGGVDRLIAAHVRLGELSWRAACPIPEWDGLCLGPRTSLPAAQEIPACGGPRQLTQYKLQDRQAPLVQAAMEQLSKALTLYRSGGVESKVGETEDPAARQHRIEALRYYVATAALLQGDHGLEQLLATQMPAGLVFDPQRPNENSASIARFKGWIDQKTERLGEAQKRFQATLQYSQPVPTVAAAGRIGQLFQAFAEELYNARLPGSPPAPSGLSSGEWSGLFKDAYCDKLSETAEPLAAKAVEAFTQCLDKARALQVTGPLAQRCEAALQALGHPLPADSAPAPRGPEAAGLLSSELIRDAVHSHLGEVAACVETAGMANRAQGGRVVVKWKIASSGRVDAAAVESSTLRDAATEQCILATLKTWSFPKPQGGFVSTSYPFELQATRDDSAPMTQSAEIRGSLSTDLVRYSIRAHIGEIKACYERGAVTRNREGRVLVRFMITSAGTVSAASVQSSTLADPETEQCILSSLKTWTFVKPEQGIVVVTYPFVLKSAGD